MPQTLELLGRRPITLESALNDESDILNWLSYGPATNQQPWVHRDSIKALIIHHLGLGREGRCCVLPPGDWLRGSFNVCVFADVTSSDSVRRVVFRCPMPHKLAETRYPGSIDEKLSAEVGAHIWVAKNCSEIPPPTIYLALA